MEISLKENIDDVFIYKYGTDYFLYSPLDKLSLKLSKNGFYLLKNNLNKEKWINLLSEYDVFKNEKPIITEYVAKIGFDGLTFMMTNACNLACKYCYASDYQDEPNFMRKDIWEKAFEYAFENRLSDISEFSLAFHGYGECTLKFDDIIEISEEFKKRTNRYNLKPVFQITTNGTFSTAECDYLVQNNFRVNLSIDGPKEINDSMRIKKNGKSPFDSIVSNTKILTKENTKEHLLARATITKESVESMVSTLEYFHSLGIRMVHFAPMDIRGAAEEINELAVDIVEFVENVKKCIHRASELDMKIYYGPFNFGIGTRFCFSQSKLTVDYLGRIIACVEAGDNSDYEEFYFGNIGVKGISFNSNDMNNLNNISVYDYSECSNCILKYHCAGYCRVNRIQWNKEDYSFEHICSANENGFAWILKELLHDKDKVKSLLDFPVAQLL